MLQADWTHSCRDSDQFGLDRILLHFLLLLPIVPIYILLEEGLVVEDHFLLFLLLSFHSLHQFVKRIYGLLFRGFFYALCCQFLPTLFDHFGEKVILLFYFELEKVLLSWHQNVIPLDIFHLFVKLPSFSES